MGDRQHKNQVFDTELILMVGCRILTLFVTSILMLSCTHQPDRTVEFHHWTPPKDMTLDLSDFLSYLMTEGSLWIRSQREALRPTAVPLAEEHLDRYALYFQPETLNKVKYQLVDIIENPGFYEELARQGIAAPLDFSKMDGITFFDTISVSRQNIKRLDLAQLLFHECIHVAQYEYLGTENFISQYVRGWAENGFDYFEIPLEKQAYEFELRFARGEIFAVEDVVAASFDRK